jgi:Trehalose receptor
MLPVDGITSDSVDDINFKLRSPKVIYSIILQALCVIELFVFIFKYDSGTTFDFINLLLSYTVGAYATVFLLFQARKWKAIMRYWSENEETFLHPPYSNRSRALAFARNVKFVAVFIIGYTIGKRFCPVTAENIISSHFSVDHFFRMSSELFRGYMKHKRCFGDDEGFWATGKSIYIEQRSIMFKVINFEYWHIPIFEWIHISRRASWGFSEVFIIVFALDLSMKFKLFNERLLRVRYQTLWSSYWKEMYEDYVKLCNLVEKGNELVSSLLVVITFTDFFFLCERLYRQYA